MDQPRPTFEPPLCKKCQQPKNFQQTRNPNSVNVGRWFMSCPTPECRDGVFWCEEYQQRLSQGAGPQSPRGNQAVPQHKGLQSLAAKQHGPQGAGAAPQASPAANGAGPSTAARLRVSVSVMDEQWVGCYAPYNETFISHMKEMEGRRWDGGAKVWKVPLLTYDEVIEKLQAYGYQLDLPPATVRDVRANRGRYTLCETRENAQQVMEAYLPADIQTRLRSFQREGVVFGIRTGGRMLLADEMGLGKTAQALCVAACFPDDFPLLIMCPATMRGTWKKEVMQWLPPALQPSPRDLWVTNSGDELEDRRQHVTPPHLPHVCITTYELVQRMPQELVRRYQVVICDESHMLKNNDAARTRAVRKIVERCRRALLLTGTPIMNRPIEIWSQVDMLKPGLLGSYYEFGNRYCLSNTGSGSQARSFPGSEFRGAHNLPELHDLLSRTVMVRRRKADVLDQLPDKIRQVHEVSIEPACKAEITALKRRLEEATEAANAKPQDPALSRTREQAWMALWRATGPAKLQEGLGLLALLLQLEEGAGGASGASRRTSGASGGGNGSSGDKLLVFAHHRAVLDGVENYCKDEGIQYVRIDGETSPSARDHAVRRFQEEEGVRVAVLSLKAAGAGITLTKATAVVFLELAQTPADHLQAEDRAHRIGQGNTVNVYYVMAKGTADDVVWPMLSRKLDVVDNALDGEMHQQQHQQQHQPYVDARGGGGAGPSGTPGRGCLLNHGGRTGMSPAGTTRGAAGDGVGGGVYDYDDSYDQGLGYPDDDMGLQPHYASQPLHNSQPQHHGSQPYSSQHNTSSQPQAGSQLRRQPQEMPQQHQQHQYQQQVHTAEAPINLTGAGYGTPPPPMHGAQGEHVGGYDGRAGGSTTTYSASQQHHPQSRSQQQQQQQSHAAYTPGVDSQGRAVPHLDFTQDATTTTTHAGPRYGGSGGRGSQQQQHEPGSRKRKAAVATLDLTQEDDD